MPEQRKKMIALWVAVGGTMTLVVVLWALLLPMQMRDGNLTDARQVSRWNVVRPPSEEAKKTWSETIDQWGAAFAPADTSASEFDSQEKSQVSETDIQKLRAKIEAASSRNESPTKPKP